LSCIAPPPEAPLSSLPITVAKEPEHQDAHWAYEHRPALHGHLLGSRWNIAASAWGASPDDIWAIADGTAIAHWDGRGWSIGESLGHELTAVWGTSARDVWIAGWDGFIHHFDGAGWQTSQLGSAMHSEITGTGPNDVYLVSAGDVGTAGHVIRHFDGTAWTELPHPRSDAYAVILQLQATAANDLWAIVLGPWEVNSQGPKSTILYRWDGRAWSQQRVWRSESGWAKLSNGSGLWLASFYGLSSTLERWDGTRWTAVAAPVLESGIDLFATSNGEAWILQPDQRLSRTDGTCWQTLRSLTQPALPEFAIQTGYVVGTDSWSGVVSSEGSVFTVDRAGWTDRIAEPSRRLRALWGTSDDDLWAVGDQGTILHRTSAGWTAVGSGTTIDLVSVWARVPDDVWAVGFSQAPDRNVVLHFDGTSFKSVDVPDSAGAAWIRVHGSNRDDVWLIAARGLVAHWDGHRWTSSNFFSETNGALDRSTTALWASGASDVWVASADGVWDYVSRNEIFTSRLARWDGARWSVDRWKGPVEVDSRPSVALWATSSSSIWTASKDGIAQWDGTSWAQISTRAAQAVWASGPGDIWAADDSQLFDRGFRHWNGSAWTSYDLWAPMSSFSVPVAVFGTAPGHVWTLGGGGVIARFKGEATSRAE
jgi:hypothetical protein